MSSTTTGVSAVLRPADLTDVLKMHEQTCSPIMVLGPPGVGKSEIIRQVSNDAERTLVYQDNASADPTDLGGMPFFFTVENPDGTLTRVTERAVAKKFIDNNKMTIFIDECLQGSTAVLNTNAPLIHEKRIGDLYLPPETWIPAASNRAQDRAGTSRAPSHLPNRMTIVEMGFQVDDTRAHWIDCDMPMELLGFAKFAPDSIFDFDPARMVNATPRQWAWVGKHFDKLMQLSQTARMATIGGRVCEGHAAKFIGFCNIFRELPSIEECLMHPDTVKIPEALDVRYAFTTALAHASTKDNFDRIMVLEKRLPKSMGVMLVADATRRDKTLRQTKAFTQWAIASANVLL